MQMIRDKITLRRLLLLLLFIGFVVILVFLLNRENKVSIGLLREIPGSPDHSAIDFDNNSVIFSNGRFIADYSEGGVNKLSNTETLPQIGEVKRSPENDFVLFSANREDLGSPTLFEKLNEDSISPDEPLYWWVVNAKTGKTSSFFSADAQQVEWSGKNTLIYARGDTLVEYNIENDSYNDIKNFAADIINFKPYENSVTVLTADKQVLRFNSASSPEEVLYESATSVEFGSKDGCFLAFHGLGAEIEEEHSESKLIGCGEKVSEVGDWLVFTPRFTDDGNHFVFFDGEFYRYIDLVSGGRGVLESPSSLTGLYLLEAPSLEQLVFTSNSSFLMSNNPFSYQPISMNQSISMGDIVIDFFKNEQVIEASKEGDYSAKDKAVIVNKISSEGLNPDLYTVVFNVLEPEGYRW